MKPWFAALLLSLAVAPDLAGQGAFPPYAVRSEFLLTPPGSTIGGLQGYINPALLSYTQQPELLLAWSDDSGRRGPANTWGTFAGVPHLGFGLVHQDVPGEDRNDYRLSVALGDRRASVGMGYGWSSGSGSFGLHRDTIVLGSLLRPWPFVSFGLALDTTPSGSFREGSVDLAVRPWRSERLTLFADYARANPQADDSAAWSSGAAFTLQPGLVVTGRYFDNRTLSFGLHLSLGRLGLEAQSRFDPDRNQTRRIYSLGVGAYERSSLRDLAGPRRQYLHLELRGPIRHRRFALFDQRHTLLELLGLIDRAAADPTIGGIALNTSGMEINPEMAWELREKLQGFRKAGKYVVAYADRLYLQGYHFASVADRIVLDPAGLVALEGLVAGQTYLKGALDKLGIGFEEWRYFEYKSALEPYTRQGMSPADRQQWQALLDDFYDLARSDICAARHLGPQEFDRLVDEQVLFLPAQALERKLVDRVGRWDEVEEAIADLEGGDRDMVDPDAYPQPRDLSWGEKPRIAVVYALGICDMEEGIRARRLVDDLAELSEDKGIAAVVLRVDSPGGDVLPSDLVAEAVEKCRRQKPVVVSQGSVAASGGYWVSMYADAIVAAPNTLTGSIGVIGGWLYDQGFKQRLGLSTDHVQVGRHADLGFGLPVPLVGLELADRNLSEDERRRVEQTFRSLYVDFVGKVARGRHMTAEETEPLAQGRVWSGRAARANGLVDRLGGLDAAIDLAREKAGLPAGRPVRLVEIPRQSLFDPAALRPVMPGLDPGSHTLGEYLRFRARHNGLPLLLLPAESLGALPLEP